MRLYNFEYEFDLDLFEFVSFENVGELTYDNPVSSWNRFTHGCSLAVGNVVSIDEERAKSDALNEIYCGLENEIAYLEETSKVVLTIKAELDKKITNSTATSDKAEKEKTQQAL